MDAYAAIKVIGEAKTPWPRDHYPMLRTGARQFKAGHEDRFRRILGQTARYMRDLNVRHAFLSTYNETIFLRKSETTLRKESRPWSTPLWSHTTTSLTPKGVLSQRANLVVFLSPG
ncbi:hypothetical protein N7471_006436 [Penicillium samsonianum]|uniref:uncharacterized protein n=1 Tax=Penicillium samsonianum TaxID=1882272 RepID=UPI002547D59A|nr:uncharacterized protein N7471_006436 [Penicillium samsonianum]KAJ6139950.1 hypothetical protein N7471_006436 [Penicillium samsonianum]